MCVCVCVCVCVLNNTVQKQSKEPKNRPRRKWSDGKAVDYPSFPWLLYRAENEELKLRRWTNIINVITTVFARSAGSIGSAALNYPRISFIFRSTGNEIRSLAKSFYGAIYQRDYTESNNHRIIRYSRFSFRWSINELVPFFSFSFFENARTRFFLPALTRTLAHAGWWLDKHFFGIVY